MTIFRVSGHRKAGLCPPPHIPPGGRSSVPGTKAGTLLHATLQASLTPSPGSHFCLWVCRASWAGGTPAAPRTGPGPEGLPASRRSQRDREGEREPLGEVPPQFGLSSRGKATWRPGTPRAIRAHAGQGHRPSSLPEHGRRTCLPPPPSLALSTLPVTRPLHTPPRSRHLEPLLLSSGQARKHHAGEERLQGMPRWAGG